MIQLFINKYSFLLFIIYYLLFMIQLFINKYSFLLFIIYYLLFIIYYLLFIIYYLLFIIQLFIYFINYPKLFSNNSKLKVIFDLYGKKEKKIIFRIICFFLDCIINKNNNYNNYKIQ